MGSNPTRSAICPHPAFSSAGYYLDLRLTFNRPLRQFMRQANVVDEIVSTASRRLGGNLRLLGLYGSGAVRPSTAHDLDFLLVVDAVENCVTFATRDCRDISPNVQFFVLNAAEYAMLPGFYRFQFAFVRKLSGNLELPPALRQDAVQSITHGFTDTLRTLRQQYKRREWNVADDWARQVWWNLKSFKYALLDTCWLLRGERPRDEERAALILEAEGLPRSAQAMTEWPDLEQAAEQLKTKPLIWISNWEPLITASYAEVRKLL